MLFIILLFCMKNGAGRLLVPIIFLIIVKFCFFTSDPSFSVFLCVQKFHIYCNNYRKKYLLKDLSHVSCRILMFYVGIFVRLLKLCTSKSILLGLEQAYRSPCHCGNYCCIICTYGFHHLCQFSLSMSVIAERWC